MESSWYLIKVLPGKERSLCEQFNQQISLGRLENIIRFVCPTEKNVVTIKNKKTLREKVIYSGYLYFESENRLGDAELKTIALIPNIMGMRGDRTPILLRDNDVKRILKDQDLENHIDSKKLKYISGEQVIITDGPFVTFNGTISEVKGDKIEVEVKIFGRNNLVSLTLNQIQKA